MSGRHRAFEDEEPDEPFVIEPEPVVRPAAQVGNGSRRRAGAPGEGAVQSPIAHRTLAPGSVRADAVSYARGGRAILDAVSLAVSPGRSLAVVGPSGSGKSSLLALLAGLEQPDSGSVVRGQGAGDGLILQGYGLVSVLSAAENVEAPLQAGVLGRLDRGEVRRRTAAVLDSVGLTAVADHLVEELSGGQQQRVAIARALVVDPAVLLADELTAELDHEWKDTVVHLVLGVAQRGGTVVLATHDLELAGRCDAVLRLVDGRVDGPLDRRVDEPE